MANEQVVDELVVKLTMDNSQYDKADKEKNKRIDATEKKERQADQQRTKRGDARKKDAVTEKRLESDRQKRLGQTERAVKSLGSTLKVFALTTAAVFGISAGVGGIVNAITNLAGFETGLRRAAVSTGMSNREMQAWGATAKRMGADADSGAAAIAALAREQKQFSLTGQGPTMQALARLGVNVSPDAKPEDMLEQAQTIYKRAAPAQQQQMEAQLSAQGVSDDLIVMIKSETDAREAYTRSVADSVEENKASSRAWNDALTTLQQASLQLANVLSTAATPYIQEFSNWVHKLASDPHQVDSWLAKTGNALQTLEEIAIQLAHTMKDAWDVVNAIAHPIAHAGAAVGHFLSKSANDFKAEDKDNTYHGAPPGLVFRRMLHSIGIGDNPDINGLTAPNNEYDPGTSPDIITGAPPTAPAPSGGSPLVSTQDFAQMLTQRGMTPAQAAAVAANAAAEAGKNGMIDPSAVNPTSGASGALQWLGPRKAAFQAKYGTDPAKAPITQQLDFLFTDPYEIATTQKAFAGGGDAATLGAKWSKIFEVHGKGPGEDQRRGMIAAQLANASNGSSSDTTAPAAGDTININGPVTVKADSPGDFVGGIQRIAQVQNYQTANR